MISATAPVLSSTAFVIASTVSDDYPTGFQPLLQPSWGRMMILTFGSDNLVSLLLVGLHIKQALPEIESNIDEADQHRHLDKRPDDRGKGHTGADAENCH